MPASRRRAVLVVGAGVVGLSAAVRLAEAGLDVRVVAREHGMRTTSAAAAAIWYPYLIEPLDRVAGWSRRSLAEFRRLAADAGTGVRLRDGVEVFTEPAADPWWAGMFPDLRHRRRLPEGYVDGLAFRTPVIEMPVYLAWLDSLAQSLGVEIETVPELAELPEPPGDAGVVVNCSGLGARQLVGDLSVQPVRGQVVLVRQPGIEEWLLDETSTTYVVPRSADVVVGGTDEIGEWDLTPDPWVAEGILERATRLVPALAGAEVLGHRVGLRPARPEVRLEAELVGDRRIVHCYGHGGAGVTVSWGCADEVVQLVTG